MAKIQNPLFMKKINNDEIKKMIERSSNSVIIPDGTTRIGAYAFYQWHRNAVGSANGLTSVTIPNTVTEIQQYAFGECFQLVLTEIPNASLGNSVFLNCSALTNITYHGKQAGQNAFKGCANLQTVTFTNDLTTIGANLFNNCTSLTKVSFTGATIVPSLNWTNTFPNGTSWTGTIEVPTALLNTWKASFGWSSLTNVTWVGI